MAGTLREGPGTRCGMLAPIMTDASELRTTRRRLVAGALATGAAAALPDAAWAGRRHQPRDRRTRRADVVVVGAGLAGLTAARQLTRAGRSVVVLEARDRPGGRVQNKALGGGRVSERGGAFVGPTQDHVVALGAGYGIGTFKTYDSGDNLYFQDGGRLAYPSDGPSGSAPLDPVLIPDLVQTVGGLDELAAAVPVDRPWKAPRAAQQDSQTLQTWLEANALTPQFRDLASAAVRPIFGAEPRELSLLFTLFYIAASGDETHPGTFERNFNTAGGAQESRFVGGSYAIVRALAHELGRRVAYGTPVRRVHQHGRDVEVVSDRVTVKARRAIVAVPPTLAGRIAFRPNLAPAHDALFQRVPQGRLLKVAAVYRSPFWRDAGLTGQVLSTATYVSATFDDSPEDGSRGIVFGFIGGDRARAYARLSRARRRAAFVAELTGFFGERARDPLRVFETDWTRATWTRGCPVGIYGPGTLLSYGARIRRVEHRVHFAGTETSTYWNGYMEGAVRSGRRAAAEVLAA